MRMKLRLLKICYLTYYSRFLKVKDMSLFIEMSG
ncbi:Uncharacterised protein [Klebsiella variicola]|nr:Uncharacterised protein [Klebsiella variicola]